MKAYQNHKLWLTLELESIDYRMLYARVCSDLNYKHTITCNVSSSVVLLVNTLPTILLEFSDTATMFAKSLVHLYVPTRTHDLIYKDKAGFKLSYSKYLHIHKVGDIKSNKQYPKLKKVVSNPFNIISDSDIKYATTVPLINRQITTLNINYTSFITSQNTLYFLQHDPTYIRIKTGTCVNSNSKFSITTYIRKDNTLADFENLTLSKMNDQPLYYLMYFKQQL